MSDNTFSFQRRSLVLALTLILGGTANAANIHVTGDCSLEAAINNANTRQRYRWPAGWL